MTCSAEAGARGRRGEGELSPANVWLSNDVHWEDIALLTHDDERLPAARVQQQFQLFQLSVGVPVRDDGGEVVGVMMLYRARDKGQPHGCAGAAFAERLLALLGARWWVHELGARWVPWAKTPASSRQC